MALIVLIGKNLVFTCVEVHESRHQILHGEMMIKHHIIQLFCITLYRRIYHKQYLNKQVRNDKDISLYLEWFITQGIS